MLIARIILALVAVGALVAAPRSSRAAAVVLAAAAVDVVLGAAPGPAVAMVVPLVAFLAAALTLAGLVERSGLAERAAGAIARAARGSGLRLYALVCAACALLTAAISLDGAVVLIVPLLLALHRRAGAPFAPLFLGSVVVANVVSIAVPQGNPTNLVVMSRLGLSPAGFVAHMLVPGLVAAGLCAVAVAIADRAALRGAIRAEAAATAKWTSEQRRAAIALAAAALAAWISPLAGIAPWWPFTAAVSVALAVSRTRPIVPWRIATQVGGLVVVTQALNLPAPVPHSLGLAGFVALAAAIGAASALANNLPVSVWASGLLVSGTSAYAATIGLAVGAMATPQGSVATLIAAELAGPCAPKLAVRRLAPLAAGALVVAALVLWVAPQGPS
jgi:arsenical pump membrane protein